MTWDLSGLKVDFEFSNSSSLLQHTLLKILLNNHSTLLMGRLGRYQSNIMTWVTPTNGKLVDRTARYIMYLLGEEKINVQYLQVIEEIYAFADHIDNQSIVLAICEKFRVRAQPGKEGIL